MILVTGSKILGAAPHIAETPTNVILPDIVWPKSVLGTYAIIDVAAPADFAPNRYEWNGSDFVRLPDPDDAPPVPESVTPRQARLALLGAGLLDAVNAAVAAAGTQAQIDWDYALEIKRSNPLIASMAAGLGLTSAQIDDLFRTAATL